MFTYAHTKFNAGSEASLSRVASCVSRSRSLPGRLGRGSSWLPRPENRWRRRHRPPNPRSCIYE
eukprot:2297452-Pleurochrysis_carterae.AAC.4